MISPHKIKDLTAQVFIGGSHLYRQLIEKLPVAVYTCDAEGHLLSYNRAAAELWGREPVLGEDLWCGSWKISYPNGEAMPTDQCPMARTLKEGKAIQGQEIVIERPDGERRHVIPHPQLIYDEDGDVVGAVNTLIDITFQKTTRHALSDSEERFRLMADQAPIMIWICDAEGQTNYLNKEWQKFTGKTADHAGWNWFELIHAENRQAVSSLWQKAFRERNVFDAKFRMKNADGDYSVVEMNASPRMGEGEHFLGYIGVLNDITLQENVRVFLKNRVEERTRELIQANKELERSNLELEQFAYVASHDLQEPLRKIQAFSNMLKKNNENLLSEDSLRHLNKITSSANRLSTLINDILNFSRLSRPTDLFVKTDLKDILDKVRSDFELMISQKMAAINIQQMPEIECVPLQMNQLFHNLLGNALKFSSPDRQPVISVLCKQIDHEEVKKDPELANDVDYYEIVFKDNGIGFDPEYRDEIFLIFKRLNGQYLYPGSGIGLALCRKIVQNHKGRIWARAKENEGAEFHIILPRNQKQAPVYPLEEEE